MFGLLLLIVVKTSSKHLDLFSIDARVKKEGGGEGGEKSITGRPCARAHGSSVALYNCGRMFRRQLDLRNSAVSSTKSMSWTPVFGRGISFTYAEYSIGESVES
ncbi:hypothetical protein EVAR_83104_1 [Eumeta japonica]|uniref:Uncharacterized protein n=1 Tax=Eumeta variegata TaxID=151549 RepID=A0A4C1WMJ5_EUMVA|nr:hypothetical protein EVAR_83104_1 [Eumeta japonica]